MDERPPPAAAIRGARGRPAISRLATMTALAALVMSGCGNFSRTAASFSARPSLTAPAATPVAPTPTTPDTSSSAGTTSSSTGPPDPCRPPDPAVVAACLAAPWGLVPLADGTSALVGERTTGLVLMVAVGHAPVVVATVPGVDSSGDGGLLGLAVGPSYAEDGVIYAYVTTATDNRILRLAAGDAAKPVFTGIPKGRMHNGGAIAFGGKFLYVATGDTGRPALAAQPTSLAGKLLRLDEFGKAAGTRKSSGGVGKPGNAVVATGFTSPTGMCPLATGRLGVLDHRPAADLLLSTSSGGAYAKPSPDDVVWTWNAASGGAADCGFAGGVLGNTSLAARRLTGIKMTALGSFTGSPQTLVDHTYGRLLTVEGGPKNLFWLTTSNKDGHGKPVAADDRVIVLPAGGGSAGGGPD